MRSFLNISYLLVIVTVLFYLSWSSVFHLDLQKCNKVQIQVDTEGDLFFINDEKINSCYASEDGSALHYKGGKLIGSIAFYKGAKSYYIHKKSNKIVEDVVPGIDLNT